MLKNQIHHRNHTISDTSIQLVLPLDYEVLIPEDDSVRLLSQIVEEMDLTDLYQAYSLSGRNSAVPPRIMLKVMLYAYMERIYSSRKIEKACRRDINFKWLLEGYPVPDHNTICRFRKERLVFCMENIFVQFIELIFKYKEVAFENLFIDGTKIEANANKYTFVWKKTADKNHNRLLEKMQVFASELNVMYGTSFEEVTTAESLRKLQRYVQKKIDTEKIGFVFGKGKRKTDLQRQYESLSEMLEKKEMYEKYSTLFDGRNNFCKTDTDATFLHMKDDHMRNAQLKPGYNMQIAVEGGYVIACDAYPNANDLGTLKPFLKKIKRMYNRTIPNITCDAGYESEENYAYLESCKQTAYIKPAMYDKWKKRSFKKDISKVENMDYDEAGDFYTCSQGRKLNFKGISKSKRRNSDYESELSIYECESCEGCPVKGKCTRAAGNRQIRISKNFKRLRENSLSNITSEKGIKLRINRSIQAEGAFGAMKEDMEFRRFLTRGTENIMVEYQLLCLGFNINKLHRKIKTGTCGNLLYEVKPAA